MAPSAERIFNRGGGDGQSNSLQLMNKQLTRSPHREYTTNYKGIEGKYQHHAESKIIKPITIDNNY
jgi:hypothetical protein